MANSLLGKKDYLSLVRVYKIRGSDRAAMSRSCNVIGRVINRQAQNAAMHK